MKRGEYPDADSGVDSSPPEWVVKFQNLSKDIGWYGAAGALYTLIYPLLGVNWLVVLALAELNHLQTNWFDRTRWGNGQTDKKSGSATADRQSMEDQETDDSGGSEVPQDDIEGEGTDSLGSFPFEAEERSTPEPHQDVDEDEPTGELNNVEHDEQDAPAQRH